MDNDNNRIEDRRKAGRGTPKIPFMKQIIQSIGKTNYKQLKVSVMVRKD